MESFAQQSLGDKNMRRIHWILAVVVTVFAVSLNAAMSLNAIAQPGGGGGQGPGMGMGMGPGGGLGQMLGGPGGLGAVFQSPQRQEAFARELGLTPQQATELQRVMQTSGETMRTRIQSAFQTAMAQRDPNAGPPNFQEMQRHMGTLMEAGFDEIQANVDRVLRPEQRAKLRETTFQLSGGLASPMLASPMGVRALDALELTDAQKEQFRRLVEARQMPNFQGVDMTTPEGRERMRTEMEAANARFAEQIRALLTPEQRAKAERLTTETAALRERIGIPAPGQPQQRGQQPGQAPPGSGFVPGQGAWQPGQGAPTPVEGQQRTRGGFPRNEN
jgi:Spy/CpxP family protein refolding chaperone